MMAATRMMIFVPITPDSARDLRAAGGTDRRLVGWAATSRMITAHGYRPDEDEDAEYAAQLYASVAALSTCAGTAGTSSGRLLVAAEVPADRVADAGDDLDHGAVRVTGLQWAEVTAVFVDEPAATESVRAARRAVQASADLRMASLCELPAVSALIDDHDLLWHHPDEDW